MTWRGLSLTYSSLDELIFVRDDSPHSLPLVDIEDLFYCKVCGERFFVTVDIYGPTIRWTEFTTRDGQYWRVCQTESGQILNETKHRCGSHR